MELRRRAESDSGSNRVFEEQYLAPFYLRVIAAIREVDADTWIFVEPRYAGPANGMPSYLPRLHDPRPGEDRIVLAPHLYSVALEANQRYAEDDDVIALFEAARTVEAARQGGPLFLGEWGLGWSWQGTDRFMRETMDLADRLLAGFAYWSWDPGGPGSWALYDRATGTDNPSAAIKVVKGSDVDGALARSTLRRALCG